MESLDGSHLFRCGGLFFFKVDQKEFSISAFDEVLLNVQVVYLLNWTCNGKQGEESFYL